MVELTRKNNATQGEVSAGSFVVLYLKCSPNKAIVFNMQWFRYLKVINCMSFLAHPGISGAV